MKVKNMNMKRVMMMALLTLLVQTVMAQSEAVQYWHHSWENVSGQNRVTNYSSLCNKYKVLDASTSLSDSREFGVGDNPEWDNGGYKWVVVKGEVIISRLIVKGEGHLILTDGCRLVCSDGVVLQGDGNSLSIYSPSSPLPLAGSPSMAADWQTSQPCGASIYTTARKSSSHERFSHHRLGRHGLHHHALRI